MRKNPLYIQNKEKIYEDLINWGFENNIKFLSNNKKAKINQIFKEYGKVYIIEVYRLTLRYMRNMYR